MTAEELIEEAAKLGPWRINLYGRIRCESGRCPIAAVAHHRGINRMASGNISAGNGDFDSALGLDARARNHLVFAADVAIAPNLAFRHREDVMSLRALMERKLLGSTEPMSDERLQGLRDIVAHAERQDFWTDEAKIVPDHLAEAIGEIDRLRARVAELEAHRDHIRATNTEEVERRRRAESEIKGILGAL